MPRLCNLLPKFQYSGHTAMAISYSPVSRKSITLGPELSAFRIGAVQNRMICPVCQGPKEHTLVTPACRRRNFYSHCISPHWIYIWDCIWLSKGPCSFYCTLLVYPLFAARILQIICHFYNQGCAETMKANILVPRMACPFQYTS